MNRNADYWIKKLNLSKHPEGGYFREVYRSPEKIGGESLPSRFEGDRVFATSIYFLLRGGEVSKLHRLKADETWHFYTGSSLTLFLIDERGKLSQIVLGPDYEKGEVFQTVIPHDCWFGAKVNDPNAYTLVGCTVAPGFEFGDFELAQRKDLLNRFPQHKNIIEQLTG
ncbi:MAG: hypothetical protein GWN16_15195 [Calditrichae bacterium]|nr:hypothetical protein [Calditrichia bacterium]